jgi:hypothetical protein
VGGSACCAHRSVRNESIPKDLTNPMMAALSRHRPSTRVTKFLGLATATVLLILGARYCVNHYVDFPVYWHASQSLLDGRRDLYDPTFVWGTPNVLMDYRYPPLFLLMFVPLGMLSYTVAGYVWFALKSVALIATVLAIDQMAGQGIRNKPLLWVCPVLIFAPYVVEEFHYGNVHFFVICLTVIALYFFERGRNVLSASLLALSISIKIFPGFFLPYFLIKRKFRYVALTLLFLLLMNFLPAFYFGFEENVELLHAWYDHVVVDREVHEFQGGINHSLKGVLLRYLSNVPYEKRIDPKFPHINLVDLSPQSLQTIWYAASGIVLLLVAVLSVRAPDSRENRPLAYGLIACAIVAFAPTTGYNYFEILILPSAVISRYLLKHYGERHSRVIFVLTVAAVLLSFVPPLMPGRALQRSIQVHSPYFFSALLLFLGIAAALHHRSYRINE